MEIRISLEETEPPAGRLRVLPESGEPPGAHDGEGVGFAGWLGLLRAMEAVLGPPEPPPPPSAGTAGA